MATKVWMGGAGATPQVNAVTPASVAIGNTFTVTVNSKAVTFVATAATVANVTAGLVAALQASAEPEFQELSYSDQGTFVSITGPVDGRPFTQTSSATGGTATNVTATTTSASGPNSWAVAANWAGGVAPVGGDDVVIDNSAVSILDGLDTTAAAFASVTVGSNFTGFIGLPERNDAGYREYRPTYLMIQGCPVSVGAGVGQGSGRIKLFSQTSAITLNVYATGSPVESGVPALLWSDAGVANNVVNVVGGSVGLAALPGRTAALTTLRVGGGVNGTAQVVGGSGLTLTTANLDGGTTTLGAGFTTLNQVAGTLTVTGTGAATAVNLDGGAVQWNSAGTITTAKVGNDGTLDFSADLRPRTVTNCTIQAQSKLLDPFRTVTFTNGVVLNRCSLLDLQGLDLGTHLTLVVTAGP